MLFAAAETPAEIKKEERVGRTPLRETYYGSASRGFSLAHEIDDKAVVAKVENDGVLKLTLPKREGTRPRTIAVQQADTRRRAARHGSVAWNRAVQDLRSGKCDHPRRRSATDFAVADSHELPRTASDRERRQSLPARS